jgi:hypothetical protein
MWIIRKWTKYFAIGIILLKERVVAGVSFFFMRPPMNTIDARQIHYAKQHHLACGFLCKTHNVFGTDLL